MTNGIIYTGDLPRCVLDRLFDNLMDRSWQSKQWFWIIYVEISSDNRSIFDRFYDVGDWEIYRISEYAEDEILLSA